MSTGVLVACQKHVLKQPNPSSQSSQTSSQSSDETQGEQANPSSASSQSSSQPSVAAQIDQPDWSKYSGALVDVMTMSKVGVLLDEIPAAQREHLVTLLKSQPSSFWEDRVKRQLRLTSLRLNFRNAFYPKGTKHQLPLPPEKLWKIELHSDPERETLDGHDYVTVEYGFNTTILTDALSPGISEPALKEIGGIWNEPFSFPIDPEFIFQRTGFACMDESQFPPNSMDSEESDLFYDQNCKVESKLSNTGCHQTQMPTMSCIDALDKKVGRVDTLLQFRRRPWDPEIANDVRLGEVTNLYGADLTPDREEFLNHRFTYRYIPANSCTLTEKCVGGPGWRHLLMFPTADLNAGGQRLDIGPVDYFLKTHGSVLSKHGVFEYSACHQHYHFSHYGSFTLGEGSEAITRKNGFCLQPTARLWNNELSQLYHPYTDCLDQGVSSGWIDEYKMGLECQWLDVSDIQSQEYLPLSFTTNPDDILCEGTPILDSDMNQQFEPTEFKTSSGEPVDKPQCTHHPGAEKNNTESYDVLIPPAGESYVTEACRDGLYGPLRNCGFTQQKEQHECAPGSKVKISCSIPVGSAAQVVRVCEASRALQSGIPCTFNESLASQTIETTKDISFTCPTARDGVEIGGSYAFFTGSLIPGEETTDVTCVVK